MKRSDVADLVTYLTQLQPAQKVDEYTADAWFDVLKDVPATLDEAREATARVARKERWIFPGAIRGELIATKRPRELTSATPAIEAPSKFEPNSDRSARITRGAALVRQALAEATPFRPGREDAADIPENLKKAREMAAADRLGQAYRDRSLKLGRAGGELMQQINHQRALSRSREE